MSRGLGRIERVCLSVLAEAEKDEPVVGRTAYDIILAAFGIEDPYSRKAREESSDDAKYRGRYVALSSVHRALKRLMARGLVQENGLTEGWDILEGQLDYKGRPYEKKYMAADNRKLYRAPGQRPILLPDLSEVPPA